MSIDFYLELPFPPVKRVGFHCLKTLIQVGTIVTSELVSQ